MQSNSQQSQQLNRDLISPSPYQCHMSVRSGPLTPGPSVSASSLAAAAAAAYDSLGLVSGPNSVSTYNTSRHSPSSPSQASSAGGLYSFNTNSPVPFGLPNSSNGTTGKWIVFFLCSSLLYSTLNQSINQINSHRCTIERKFIARSDRRIAISFIFILLFKKNYFCSIYRVNITRRFRSNSCCNSSSNYGYDIVSILVTSSVTLVLKIKYKVTISHHTTHRPARTYTVLHTCLNACVWANKYDFSFNFFRLFQCKQFVFFFAFLLPCMYSEWSKVWVYWTHQYIKERRIRIRIRNVNKFMKLSWVCACVCACVQFHDVQYSKWHRRFQFHQKKKEKCISSRIFQQQQSKEKPASQQFMIFFSIKWAHI